MARVLLDKLLDEQLTADWLKSGPWRWSRDRRL